MKRTTRRKAGRSGQSLFEFAFIVPVLFILVMNVVNFAGMLFAWICVQNAARTGAQYLVMAGASPGAPTQATQGAVASLVTSDLSSLPNNASAQIGVCVNNNGTVTCTGTGTPPADPEAGAFVSASVDVTYTYKPLAGTWSLLGVSPTAFIGAAADGSITLHRRAVMRVLQ